MDNDHVLKIPNNPIFYGIENCTTFLPKIEKFIYKTMKNTHSSA